MANQVSHDKYGIMNIINDLDVTVFSRVEGVLQAGSPDVAGWESTYLITAKLNPAGQGGSATPPVVPAQTVDASTGAYNRS